MRIGEVLKLTPSDIDDRKLTLQPQGRQEREIVFIPQKIAESPQGIITKKGIGPNQRIFPNILYGRKRSCEQSRKGGRDPFETPRSQAALSDLCFSSGVPIENREQGDPQTCESIHDPEVFGTVSDAEQ